MGSSLECAESVSDAILAIAKLQELIPHPCVSSDYPNSQGTLNLFREYLSYSQSSAKLLVHDAFSALHRLFYDPRGFFATPGH